MLYRLRQSFLRARFRRRIRAVFDTPPLRAEGGADAPELVTQLCHRDVDMYLLAAKSLGRFLPVRAIHVLDDGSLTAEDKSLLSEHFPGHRLLDIAGLGGPRCPRGGTWERLLFIADRVADSYVVQLDADTVTLADPVEVQAAVRHRASFTLGTGLGREIVPAARAAQAARGYDGAGGEHIQVTAERVLDRLPGPEERRYVRGNSGFAGFARGSFTREALEEFSASMRELVGERWSEWGSEQVSSSYVVANSPSARVLPFPRYGYYDPARPWQDGVFVHFMGTHRFSHGAYAAAGRRAIRELAGA